ncbi:hypothetical protein [Williamsia sp. CHRR-6]|uniref:DUF7373 family lipoprotein n=1 Tax=Williamsia sp. CHRR-6 TaxID=2835871 RepID=UPI001BDAA9C6|nr:hypothetical protein [Williamsia sp. CHRR-6]MBT0568559.1 hypothetical protein [Williamsia sp. CHRR-6]
MTSRPVRLARYIALGLACILTVVGCANSVGGSAKPRPGDLVNLKALDTGTFQTDPSPPFPPVTSSTPDAELIRVEEQRMAEFIILPADVDPELRDYNEPTGTMPATAEAVLGSKRAYTDLLKTTLGGFTAAAGSPGTAGKTYPKLSLTLMVARFITPQDAAAAAKKAIDTVVADSTAAPADEVQRPVAVPGVAFAARMARSVSGGPALLSATPSGVFVIFARTLGEPDQESKLAPLLTKATAAQITEIKKFPALARGPNAQLPVDSDSILIYTIPDADSANRAGTTRAVYGPTGASHFAGDDQPAVRKLFVDTGTDHIAVWKTTVFRSATAAGASRVMTTQMPNPSATIRVTSPPVGLPVARCLSRDTVIGPQYECWVQVGRYLGVATDRSAVTTRQMISAQYKILLKADQNHS